jgi:probable F420-dependent oxidoreductase
VPGARRPFRFLADARDVPDARALGEAARRAEGMGYSVLVIPDHLIDQLSPVPAMTAIAAATETLRVGSFVLNNDLRHPAVLAQDLASVDVLSHGRLEIGIGAGWNRPEYDAAGIPFEPVATRVARLEEAVTVLKGLFANEPLTFKGEHYTITGMDGRPKPLQRPHPPILIGGGGRRILEFAAREANIIGLAPRIAHARGDPLSVTAEATGEKIDWIREAAGARFADIEFNVYPTLSEPILTDDARGEGAKLAARLRDRAEVSVDDLLDSPHIFIGSVDGLVEKFRALRERFGITSIMVGGMDQLAPVVERLAGS